MTIIFSQGEKKFFYPDAFDRFLTVSDNKIAEFIRLEINKKEIISRRKIECLMHFTRIENLRSILQNGLIPVSLQQKMKIQAMRDT